jgi:predicted alpha/beta superfamily hydrolase
MRLKRARTGFLPLFFCFAASGVLLAQADNAAITYGNYRKIHSKVLGEDRTLLIRLPADYDKSGKAYPVLYKLDGDKEISLQTFSTLDYLVDMTDKVPDHIVVGIENTDRTRDMNPDRGAVNFIQFIKTELILFIDKNYRTSGFKILGGESASSMFALYSFLKEPALFDAYLLSSFGLYNESQAAYFTNELGKNQYLKKVGKKYIFVANGRKDAYDRDGSITKRGAQFLESLKQTVPASVQIKSVYYDDEGHVPFPSTYDGLRWIYSCEKAATKK